MIAERLDKTASIGLSLILIPRHHFSSFFFDLKRWYGGNKFEKYQILDYQNLLFDPISVIITFSPKDDPMIYKGHLAFKRMILFVVTVVIVIVLTSCMTIYFVLDFYKARSAYRHRIDLPNAIEVLEPVRIGDIDQWISIRGHNQDAPILLYLHGGPGFDMIRFAHEFSGPWEEYFTVVFWDQRGTGKSYY